MWKNIFEKDVFNCGTDQKDGLQKASKCAILFYLSWWHTFLESWNGLSLLRSPVVPKVPAHYIQTDASGAWGCGAYFSGQWFQLQWYSHWKPHHIMVKELLFIVLNAVVWGSQFRGQTVMF